MSNLKQLLQNCMDEMGPKVFDQFRKDMAGQSQLSGEPLIPCSCEGTGFIDKINRGISMEPADKICPECKARGWKLTPNTGDETDEL